MPESERRREIEDILVDAYDDEEQLSAWEVAFEDGIATPFRATVFGASVEVRGFRAEHGHVQCRAVGAGRDRWIGVEALDPAGLPADFTHVLELYEAWHSGSY